MKDKKPIFKIVIVGVFAALVFVSSMISIPIPVAIGSLTRIHLGNIFCLLSGFILGPIGGGLASGIGSALYDVTNPAYITSAPFTFVFKFALSFVCGLIAYSRGSAGKNIKKNILAAALGSITYIILHLGKSFIEGLLLGNAVGAVLPSIIMRLGTSSMNAVIAVAVSVPLALVLRAALKKSDLL